jgi:hypothetical protein
MAQIYMPIEIKPDNTIVSRHEYADIQIMSTIPNFEQFKRPVPAVSLTDQIFSMLDVSKTQDVPTEEHVLNHIDNSVQIVVQKTDIKPRTRSAYYNTSFKRKSSYHVRRTAKSRPAILKSKDAGSSPPLMAPAAELGDDR